MNRIKLTPYAYVAGGIVHMFRTCPKSITELPKVLYYFGQPLHLKIITNRKGVRMIMVYFALGDNWNFYQTIDETRYRYNAMSEYLKNRK